MNAEEPLPDDEHSEAADLAWAYVQNVRAGFEPQIEAYRNQLLSDVDKEEFDFLVAMDAFCEASVERQMRNPEDEL